MDNFATTMPSHTECTDDLFPEMLEDSLIDIEGWPSKTDDLALNTDIFKDVMMPSEFDLGPYGSVVPSLGKIPVDQCDGNANRELVSRSCLPNSFFDTTMANTSVSSIPDGSATPDQSSMSVRQLGHMESSNMSTLSEFNEDSLFKKREAKPTRRRINNTEWEKYQDIIKSLYIDDDRTLLETKNILEKEHGFKTSDKALKAMLRGWAYKKNLDKEQAKFMLKKSKQRKSQGKQTVFVYRGAKVPEVRLQRYSKGLSLTSSIGKTPSFVTYFTPESSFKRSARREDTNTSDDQADARRKEQILGKNVRTTKRKMVYNVIDAPHSSRGSALELTAQSEHVTESKGTKTFQGDGVFNCTPRERASREVQRDNMIPQEILDGVNDAILLTNDKRIDRFESLDIWARQITVILRRFVELCTQCGTLLPAAVFLETLSSKIFRAFNKPFWELYMNREETFENTIFRRTVMYHEAACLLAATSYAESEIVLDKVLGLNEDMVLFPRDPEQTKALRQITNLDCMVLLAKAHLAQGKFNLVQGHLLSFLHGTEGNNLFEDKKPFHLTSEGACALHRLLVIAKTMDFRQNCSCGSGPETVQKILSALQPLSVETARSEDTQFSLQVLSFLCTHCDDYKEDAIFNLVLDHMRVVLLLVPIQMDQGWRHACYMFLKLWNKLALKMPHDPVGFTARIADLRCIAKEFNSALYDDIATVTTLNVISEKEHVRVVDSSGTWFLPYEPYEIEIDEAVNRFFSKFDPVRALFDSFERILSIDWPPLSLAATVGYDSQRIQNCA